MTEPGFTLSRLAYFGRGAVRRLEDGVPGDVVDVAARRDADAADLRGERVGEVVAVQVRRGDDVELVGPRQHLLQRDVGDRVLDQRDRRPACRRESGTTDRRRSRRRRRTPSRLCSPNRGRRLR